MKSENLKPAPPSKDKKLWSLKKKIALGIAAATIGIAGILGYQQYVESTDSSNNSSVITADGFDDKPPVRPENLSRTAPDQLPLITQYTEYYKGGNVDNFNIGLIFRLRERPPAERTIFAPGGVDPKIVTEHFLPTAIMYGYLIQKELQADGSVMLAIEIPGRDGRPFTQEDINTAPLSLYKWINNGKEGEEGNEGILRGAIVWLKIENFIGYKLPFIFDSSWNYPDRGRESAKFTNIPDEMFKYLRIGDPLRAYAVTQLTSSSNQDLIDNYQNRTGNVSYEDAQEKFRKITDGNTLTIQKMIEDAKSGNISLKDQLEKKTYVLQAVGVDFVIRSLQ